MGSIGTKHKAYDRRTPGLFKVEAEGDELISLCSKTYFLKQKDSFKMSCKGINKANVVDPYGIYSKVLQDKISLPGTNSGFRARDNTIYTYTQERTGFSYFYCKREVCADGISTKPLNLVLCPWPKNVLFVEYNSPLSLYAHQMFKHEDKHFISVLQAIEYEKALYHNHVDLANQMLKCRNMFEFYKVNVRYAIDSKWYVECLDKMRAIVTNVYELQIVKAALRTSKSIIVCGEDKYWSCGFKPHIAKVTHVDKMIGQIC